MLQPAPIGGMRFFETLFSSLHVSSYGNQARVRRMVPLEWVGLALASDVLNIRILI